MEYQDNSILCLSFLQALIDDPKRLDIVNKIEIDRKEMIKAFYGSILLFMTIINSENIYKNQKFFIDEKK